MTNMEYVEAFMRGALDAWKLAQRHPDLLDSDYLTVRSAEQLANEVKMANNSKEEE